MATTKKPAPETGAQPAAPAIQPTKAERDLQDALSELNDFGNLCEVDGETDTEEFWRIADTVNVAATKVLQERGVTVAEPRRNKTYP